MPISAQQWRVQTGMMNASRGFRPTSTKPPYLFNLPLPSPTDWKEYNTALVMLCLPLFCRIYAVCMAVLTYLGTHGLAEHIYCRVIGSSSDDRSMYDERQPDGVSLFLVSYFAVVNGVMVKMIRSVASTQSAIECVHTTYNSVKMKVTEVTFKALLSFVSQWSASSLVLAMLLLLAGDVERNPGPPPVLKTLVNELHTVKDKYCEIGIQLGIVMSDIRTIEIQHPTIDRRLSEVLIFWLEGSTEVPVCWKSVVDALENMDKKALTEQLHAKYCVPKEEIQSEVSTSSDEDDDLKEPPPKKTCIDRGDPFEPYCKKLASIYCHKPEVPEGTWPPVRSTHYVTLALIKSQPISFGKDFARQTIRGSIDDILNEKDDIAYGDIFKDLESGARLLLEGRPGCGKTTMMHKLSQDWGHNKLLQDKLLFLVHLRRFANRSDVGLSDLIRAASAELTESDVEFLCSHITSTGGEGVVFAIDGLDEYDPENKRNNFIFNLINRDVLPNSVVIVASRPAATKRFRHNATKRIEVLGFLKEQIEEYVTSYFVGQEEKAKGLMEYLKHHLNVFHICYIPLHCAMVSYLFELEGSALPATETEIYRHFTFSTLLRSMCNRENMKASEVSFQLECFNDLTEEDRVLFTMICKLAFEATVSSRQVFSQQDVKKFFKKEIGSTGNDQSTLGLIVIDRYFVKYGLSEIYSFLHLTIQEYLSACHIALLSDSEQWRVITLHAGDKRLAEVWKFYCGIVELSTTETLENFKLLLEKTEDNKLLHFQCAFESQQDVACSHIIESCNGSIEIHNQSLNPTDCTALGYVLCRSEQLKSPCTSLALPKCRIGPEGFDAILKQIGECTLSLETFKYGKEIKMDTAPGLGELLKKLPSLRILHLEDCKLNSKTLKVVVPSIPEDVTEVYFGDLRLGPNSYSLFSRLMSRLPNLRRFDFRGKKIGDVGAQALADSLTHCTSLQTLNFGSNNIGDAGAQALADGLTHCTSLQTLYLRNNNIGDAGAQALADSLTHCTSLQRLDLEGNNIGDAGAQALADSLTHCTSLQTLDLRDNNIGDAGAQALADSLTHCTSLQTLSLSDNNIEDAGAQALADSLTHCTSLQTLSLRDNNIGDAGAQALADSLTHCTSLQRLDLEGNNIGDAGAQALADSLTHCTSLQTLDLWKNNIGDAGAQALADSLTHCTSLQRLDLWSNKFTDNGERALRKAAEERNSTSDAKKLNLVL